MPILGYSRNLNLLFPPEFTVSGNPGLEVVSFTVGKSNETPNTIWMNGASSGQPAFGNVVNTTLPNVGPTPGLYTSVNATVNSEGFITSAANGGGGTLSAVALSLPLYNMTSNIVSNVETLSGALASETANQVFGVPNSNGQPLFESISSTQIPFQGAQLGFSSSSTTFTLPCAIPWTTKDFDTNSFWNVANPTRLTIPAGVRNVTIYGQFCNSYIVTSHGTFLYKNGASMTTAPNFYGKGTSGIGLFRYVIAPNLKVNAGDYFELYCYTSSSESGSGPISDLTLSFFGIMVNN